MAHVTLALLINWYIDWWSKNEIYNWKKLRNLQILKYLHILRFLVWRTEKIDTIFHLLKLDMHLCYTAGITFTIESNFTRVCLFCLVEKTEYVSCEETLSNNRPIKARSGNNVRRGTFISPRLYSVAIERHVRVDNVASTEANRWWLSSFREGEPDF